MVGTVGPYYLYLKSRQILTATPPVPVCTAAGPGSYTITSIDTFNIFPLALSTSVITILYESNGVDTLTRTPSAIVPHITLSGTLTPGDHVYQITINDGCQIINEFITFSCNSACVASTANVNV